MKSIICTLSILSIAISSYCQLSNEQVFDAYVSQNRANLISQMQQKEFELNLPPSGVSITTLAKYPLNIYFDKTFCEIYRIEIFLSFDGDVLSIGEGWQIENLGQKINNNVPDAKMDSEIANTAEICYFKDGRFESTITAINGSFNLTEFKVKVYGIPNNPNCSN